MKLFIDKYPEFIAVKIKSSDVFDKRVLIIRPGEDLVLPQLRLSYIEQPTDHQLSIEEKELKRAQGISAALFRSPRSLLIIA